MEKLKMINPIVEMDGDEMTRILWKMIKDDLLYPFIELKTEYYDLGLPYRDETDDKVTVEAAEAIKKWHVGVKCATITPNAKRVEEYHLKKMYKSPNGTIRAALDGTVFRTPILIPGVKPYVRTWESPITIARHAYGDIYKATEYRVPEKGKAKLVFDGENGDHFEETIYDYECPGVLQGQYNKDSSISSFASSCFEFALSLKQDLWFAAKDTIAKAYDGTFRDIFSDLYETKYKEKFEEANIEYHYTLIDDAVARVIRSKGGFIWACKNYDGDVMSDMISAAFGSIAMMKSILVSPDGNYEFEAAHGTITRHYYKYLEGEETSSNPVATIYAWSGAIRQRGIFDNTNELIEFADKLESACLKVMEEGTVTKDIAGLRGSEYPYVTSDQFIKAIKAKLEEAYN